MRTFAIGDIHGCATALRSLLKEVPFSKEDTLVTLGDYVDRGSDSKGVIDRLLTLRDEVNLITLRGNHEVMMMIARHHAMARIDWLQCGGDTTLASYRGCPEGAVPREHWEFIESTLPYHETEENIFVHANVNPNRPMSDQTDHTLYWERGWIAKPHPSGRTIICGHTPQRDGRPEDIGHLICIDTYVYGDGWLTCLEPATGQYWQADNDGSTREGVLKRGK